MSNQENDDPAKGPGTTEDPNQASRTAIPTTPPVAPEVDDRVDDGDDPSVGPGSTGDPNQANRT